MRDDVGSRFCIEEILKVGKTGDGGAFTLNLEPKSYCVTLV